MSVDIARDWLSRFLKGPTSQFSDEEVIAFVDVAYPGGVAELSKPLEPMDVRERPAFWAKDRDNRPRDLPDTPLRKRARVSGLTGFRLPLHADWVDANIESDEIIIHIVVREVTETSRRVKVNREGQRLIRFKRHGFLWKRDEVTVWSDDPSYSVHIFGRIMTPEVAADQREQFETCWRPGTKSTPMKGPAARAEMSWKDYWGDDAPQAPKKGSKS